MTYQFGLVTGVYVPLFDFNRGWHVLTNAPNAPGHGTLDRRKRSAERIIAG